MRERGSDVTTTLQWMTRLVTWMQKQRPCWRLGREPETRAVDTMKVSMMEACQEARAMPKSQQ